jgi:hypothetical protein
MSKKRAFDEAGCSPEAAEYLATQLERLMALPISSLSEIEKWDDECEAVQAELKMRFPGFDPLHEVWHFFGDSDIRRRNSGYRDRQHRIISDYVKHLRAEIRAGQH